MSSKRWRTKKAYTGPLTRQGRSIAGQDYTSSCGRCVTPPWEICVCSALLKPQAEQWSLMAERFNEQADERVQMALLDETA